MPLALLTQNPLSFVAWVIAILVALSTHEFMHALAGTLLGDSTAKNQGRLTLNPIAHVDLIGFLALIFIGFGWGKPVPFNPHNLRYKRWGPSLVALAGPSANFVVALSSMAVLKVLNITVALPPGNLLLQFLHLLLLINIILMVFNLLPIPPLDGSKVLFGFLSSPRYNNLRYTLETRGPMILILFIILDGFLGIGILSRLFGWIINFVYGFV
ncbi:MAG: site-2 protease family protein [Patescibacteria group bacterium]|nr:site-2 protease family protein [Patescibacteria group bacterium]